jgi:hypothetical protein
MSSKLAAPAGQVSLVFGLGDRTCLGEATMSGPPKMAIVTGDQVSRSPGSRGPAKSPSVC